MKGQCPPHSLAHADAHMRRGWPPAEGPPPQPHWEGGSTEDEPPRRDAGWGTWPRHAPPGVWQDRASPVHVCPSTPRPHFRDSS